MARSQVLLVAVLVAVLVSVAAAGDPANSCVYTVYLQTGYIIKAGTDSRISLTASDATGDGVYVSDLESDWGAMGPGHDYYERGNLDIFTGRGPCLTPPLCRLNLTSDGSGSHHGWYVDTVEITSTGPHMPCSQTLFYVRQWLANDAPPYELTAVVDGCGAAALRRGKVGRVVIGGGGDDATVSADGGVAAAAA